MAAWLELHQTLITHRKLYRLADELRVDRMQAVGHLCALWLWALDQAEDGDITDYPPYAIAEAAQWRKKPEPFVRALEAAGWIDVGPGGERAIHDWLQYAGRLLDRRAHDRERKRKLREMSRGQSRGQDAGQGRDAPRPFQPYRTEPNRTEPMMMITHSSDPE